MKPILIKPIRGLRGTIALPGDKSISHRAVLLSALANGRTTIENFLFSDDCLITLNVLKELGVKVLVDKKRSRVVIESQGCLCAPRRPLFMGESGTSARLFTGLLAGQDFSSRLTAAASLLKRPMARVIDPLTEMDARICGRMRGRECYLPLEISSSRLRGISWTQKVSSAQVKSAILLAGLFAHGETLVREPLPTRDHTERMLKLFGAPVHVGKKGIRISRSRLVTPGRLVIPGDISSAVFFIVGALLVKNSMIRLGGVGVNPTRLGAVRVLKRMGGRIRLTDQRGSFEPVADIDVSTSVLKSTIIRKEEIPALIDELPVLMVAASLAKGRTVIEGIGELRVKETDRIRSMCLNLTKLGVDIQVKSLKKRESVVITGVKSLKAGSLMSFLDHRTAMSMVVAGLTCKSSSKLDDVGCISKSFPGFLTALRQLFVL